VIELPADLAGFEAAARELEAAMAFCGAPDVARLTRDLVVP
jgi:hypothetical protein